MIDLRQARFHRGLDLAAVADALDISVSYLSMIERRKAVPAAPIAKRIADFYGHDVAEIWPHPVDEPKAAA